MLFEGAHAAADPEDDDVGAAAGGGEAGPVGAGAGAGGAEAGAGGAEVGADGEDAQDEAQKQILNYVQGHLTYFMDSNFFFTFMSKCPPELKKVEYDEVNRHKKQTKEAKQKKTAEVGVLSEWLLKDGVRGMEARFEKIDADQVDLLVTTINAGQAKIRALDIKKKGPSGYKLDAITKKGLTEFLTTPPSYFVACQAKEHSQKFFWPAGDPVRERADAMAKMDPSSVESYLKAKSTNQRDADFMAPANSALILHRSSKAMVGEESYLRKPSEKPVIVSFHQQKQVKVSGGSTHVTGVGAPKGDGVKVVHIPEPAADEGQQEPEETPMDVIFSTLSGICKDKPALAPAAWVFEKPM
jgi:hypothetical protein